MIELKNFCKEYKSRSKTVFKVQDLSFTVEKGSITGLVGPNGSGKSTVIKAICGFHYPTSGQILISDNQNQAVNISDHNEKVMELCGYVPEISRLPVDMKVIDFLTYAAKVHKLNEQTARQRVTKLCQDFELSDLLDKLIKNLSKGQQQRVSFAQALIHDPPNLILDEPINGLDPSQIIKLRAYIKDLSRNKAILISTHILNEVNKLCGKAFIMHEGKIYSVEKLDKIEEEYLKLTAGEIKS